MFALPAPLSLRPASAADCSFLDQLYRGTRDDLVHAAPSEAALTHLLRLQQQAEALGLRSAFPEAQSLILVCGTVPIGRVLIEARGDRLHLVDLALLPNERSRGHGSAVLRALQRAASARSTPLTLSVSRTNPAARSLYIRHGFVVTDADLVCERLVWDLAQQTLEMSH